MRLHLTLLGAICLLCLSSCEEMDRKQVRPQVQVNRQAVQTRDLLLENQSLDKELRRHQKELDELQKLTQAQKGDIERLRKEKGEIAKLHSAAEGRIEKLQKEREKQASALQHSTQTSDRLSKENELLRRQIESIKKELNAAQKAKAVEKEAAKPKSPTPE